MIPEIEFALQFMPRSSHTPGDLLLATYRHCANPTTTTVKLLCQTQSLVRSFARSGSSSSNNNRIHLQRLRCPVHPPPLPRKHKRNEWQRRAELHPGHPSATTTTTKRMTEKERTPDSKAPHSIAGAQQQQQLPSERPKRQLPLPPHPPTPLEYPFRWPQFPLLLLSWKSFTGFCFFSHTFYWSTTIDFVFKYSARSTLKQQPLGRNSYYSSSKEEEASGEKSQRHLEAKDTRRRRRLRTTSTTIIITTHNRGRSRASKNCCPSDDRGREGDTVSPPKLAGASKVFTH